MSIFDRPARYYTITPASATVSKSSRYNSELLYPKPRSVKHLFNQAIVWIALVTGMVLSGYYFFILFIK